MRQSAHYSNWEKSQSFFESDEEPSDKPSDTATRSQYACTSGSSSYSVVLAITKQVLLTTHNIINK